MDEGEELAWAARFAALRADTEAVITEAARQLAAPIGATIVSTPGLTAARRLLLPAGAWVAAALVLEADLAPSLPGAIPLFVAAWARLFHPVPRATAVHGFMNNPGLSALLGERPLAARRIAFSARARPSRHVREIVLRAWPLLSLTDAEVIRGRITRTVAAWLPDEPPSRDREKLPL